MCVCVYLLTLRSSLSLSQCFSVYVTTFITFCSVCVYVHTFVCVCTCLRTSVSEYTPSLWICAPLNSSPCHSVCPLFHEAVCLLSGVRWHIIFPYLSILSILPHFCLLSRCFFLFCLAIRAIRVHSLQGLDTICRMISELMLHFCTIPTSNCLVKTGFPLFSAVRSHKEWPDRRLREASVLYFNILICLYCLCYTTLKKEMSAGLMHYRCTRNA